MKKFRNLLAAVIISCMLVLPTAITASAADLVDPDNISAMLEMILGSDVDLSNPDSIREAISKITSGGFGGIIDFIGGGDILDVLNDYLNAFESELTTKAPETTTAEPTTPEPTTSPRPTYPSYNSTPTAPTAPPSTTQPAETTTFQYIPPEQIYTEPYTTTVFNPIVQDNGQTGSDTSPLATGVGILLLLGSSVGVLVVVVALKKNRI